MKKYLFAGAVAFGFSTFIYAQDCTWKEKKKDSFTGTSYLRTKNLSKAIMGERPSPETSTFISAYLEANNKTVSFQIIYTTTQELKLKKVSKPVMMVKFADGTILTLNSENEFDITTLKNQEKQSNLVWNISKDDLKKLASNEINAMRISFGGADYTYLLKETASKEFLNMFNCMNKEI